MRKIIINVPDNAKGGTVSIMVAELDGSVSLKTVGITTQDILNGNEIDVIFEESGASE